MTKTIMFLAAYNVLINKLTKRVEEWKEIKIMKTKMNNSKKLFLVGGIVNAKERKQNVRSDNDKGKRNMLKMLMMIR